MPSMTLIPAYTLTWIPFVFDTSTVSMPNNQFLAQLGAYLYSDYAGMNISVGVYGPDGIFINADPIRLPSNWCNQAPCTWMGTSPNGAPNQIMPNESAKATGTFPVSLSNLTLQQGDIFYVAFVANHPIWIGGFSTSDRSGGSGLQYGQSPWETPVTDEASMGQLSVKLPPSLPPPALTSSFEIAISGTVSTPI
jgi:hypothetical protein